MPPTKMSSWVAHARCSLETPLTPEARWKAELYVEKQVIWTSIYALTLHFSETLGKLLIATWTMEGTLKLGTLYV